MKKFVTLLATSCLFALSLIATTEVAPIVLPQNDEMNIQAQRFAVTPADVLEDYTLANLFGGNNDDAQFMQRIHPDCYYYPYAVTSSGDNIQLHDASRWYVHPYNRNAVKEWDLGDLLFIKPNASCFSSYAYVIQNRRTQQVVEVNLLHAPNDAVSSNFIIAGIDRENRLAYLNDGSVWKINPKDVSFRLWQVGQRVLVGLNNYWRTNAYPHIIINASIYKAPYCEADFVENQ